MANVLEEVGMTELLQEQPCELDTEENAIDPLQERLDIKRKHANTWQFDDGEFQSENLISLPKYAKTEHVNIDGWCNIRDLDTESMVIQNFDLQPEIKGPALTVCNPLDAWLLLLDEPIIMLILQHTNAEIRGRRGKNSYERTTDPLELRAWIGLNYLAGLFRNSPHVGPLDELWSLELGNAVFRSAMSINRYDFLSSCLRLSSGKTAKSNLSEVWKKFIINCRSYYVPSSFVVVDHQETDLLLCDAKTLYLHNMLKVVHQREHVEKIHELVSDIKGSARLVVTNSKFTSIELGERLQMHNLALLGELNNTQKKIPDELFWHQDTSQALYKETFCFYAGNLLSNCLGSSLNAPEMYKTTFDSCQKFKKTAEVFSTHFGTPSKQLNSKELLEFHNLLNYAAYNAWVLLRLSVSEDANLEQRDFMRRLGLYLTQQLLRRRLSHPERLSTTQKVLISEMLDEPLDKVLTLSPVQVSQVQIVPVPNGVMMQSRISEKRQRCRKCKGKNSPKTRVRCQQCLRNLCYRHIVFRCDDCTGVANCIELSTLKENTIRTIE